MVPSQGMHQAREVDACGPGLPCPKGSRCCSFQTTNGSAFTSCLVDTSEIACDQVPTSGDA
ncbi:hypothetical protein BDP27DRAFT_600246 [Rhodocollybia butyracea]|uniref:Uncharacterized protein n=1 Tax=Rhodocollybia butyracea TaxID=206335 RepID=A0A9P5Q310_9AGAR|nr:hypothetical protein BDP27DRAFT_600246 [Rhodocollybia butyracea]